MHNDEFCIDSSFSDFTSKIILYYANSQKTSKSICMMMQRPVSREVKCQKITSMCQKETDGSIYAKPI